MKPLVYTVCLLISLGLVLVFFNRRNSCSGDDAVVQEEMAGRKQSARIIMEEAYPNARTVKSIEPSPVTEMMPPAETLTAEPAPLTYDSSSETKTVPAPEPDSAAEETGKSASPDVRLMETKLSAEGKQAPAAVPVATPEEAEKANRFAVFLSLRESTVVEGTIVERSKLPDPQKSDYPNCRFTAHFEGNSIKSGEACPREIVLIIDGFECFQVLSTNELKEGDKVLCNIIPLEDLPEEEQSTQQADDLELFLLDSYYVVGVKTIREFSEKNRLMPSSGILFSEGNEEYVSLFERHINPPIPDAVKKAQISTVQDDLRKMNELLAGFDEKEIDIINKRFDDVWKKEKEKDANGYNRIKKTVWRNIDNSFWTLPEDYTLLKKPSLINPNMLSCFQSLKRVCEENGVQLIISLVPNFYDISARVINKEFRDIPDLQTATYVKQLSEIGIEAIYASDTIIENYNRFPFAFFFPTNYHPGDTTQDVLSDIIAKRLLRYEFDSELNPELFSESQCISSYGPDAYLFPQNCDIGSNQTGEAFMFRKILYDGKTIPNTKDSSVFVIGNSFIKYPVSPPESLPVLLSYKTCSPIHWARRDGYGPFCEFLTELLSNPDSFLKNKCVLIMQVGTDHITTISNNESMIDISQIDSEQCLLNNKSMNHCFLLSSNTTEDIISNKNIWGPISDKKKAVFTIDQSGEMNFHFDLNNETLDNGINDSKPVLCVVSHTCASKTFCQLSVNGTSKTMYYSTYPSGSKFFNLAFELPAGTKEITIRIEGKPDSIFAIKDIQIWQ